MFRGRLLWTFLAVYAALIIAGTLVLRAPGIMPAGNELSFERALFSAINALTLTGFAQMIDVEQYAASGQAAVFGLTIAGTLWCLIGGGWAVNQITGGRHAAGRIVRAALILEAGAILLGMLTTAELWPSVFAAVSAMGNSGLAIGDIETGGKLHGLLLPLSIIGGLGAVVMLDVWDWLHRRGPFSAYGLAVLTAAAATYLGGMLTLILLQWIEGGSANVRLASAMCLNARSAGFPLTGLSDMARSGQWFLLVLMLIGGSSGGTAGGLKSNNFTKKGSGVVFAFLKNDSRPLFWLGSYLGLILLGQIALLAVTPATTAERLLFIVVSAATNTGLSQEPIALTGLSLHILTGTMLLGRLLPLAALWWAATKRSS